MINIRIAYLQKLVTVALQHHLPVSRDDAWLEKFVDTPRFGWDWGALELGFFKPFHLWSTQHPARLRPVFAGLLIDVLGEKSEQHTDLLCALEIQFLAAIMLDDVPNGRDISTATSDTVTIPLPTWVTISYNARQLVPVMLMRQRSSLPAASRAKLAQCFTRFRFQQGLGSSLDLWGSEQTMTHLSEDEFITHLRLYIGNLSFGLACDVSSAVVGLEHVAATQLRQAGIELGVSLRLMALAHGYNRELRMGRHASQEPIIRWKNGIDPMCFNDMAMRSHDRALTLARAIDPSVVEVFTGFFNALQHQALGESLC